MTELIIGRESGVENPRLSVTFNGQTVFVGPPGSVSKDVSRKHCKITIDNDKISIEDLTNNNFTYVNGSDCKKKSDIRIQDNVELGPSRYHLDLETIIKAATSKQAYSIKHLKAVYDNYQQAKFDMQVKQGKLNALSALPGVLSMTSIGIAVFLPNARFIMIIVAALFALAFALIRYINASKVPLKSREIEESFREKYVCPNPACKHFLGFTPYNELMKNRSCPYCRSKFSE
ncbi:MAG: FHA domain-containing protein [Bacteroidales bacterium]|nr:FHA domain-containing protein [Bacteroidales bacterium]